MLFFLFLFIFNQLHKHITISNQNQITLSRRKGNTTRQSKHSLSELNLRSSPMRIDTPPTTKQTEIVLVEYSRRLSNRATSESGVHGGSCIQLGGKGSFKTPQMSIHYSSTNQNPTRKSEVAGIAQPCFLNYNRTISSSGMSEDLFSAHPDWDVIVILLFHQSIDRLFHLFTPFHKLHKYFMTFSTWKEWRRCNPSPNYHKCPIFHPSPSSISLLS